MISNDVVQSPLTAARVRAYFAPTSRGGALGLGTVFDPAQMGSFALDTPPSPWIDLGWVRGFTRKGLSHTAPVLTGAPGAITELVRSTMDASVSCAFDTWGKLQAALTCGTLQMNLLASAAGTATGISGGSGVAAVPVAAGSTATQLNVGSASTGFRAGSFIAVDNDYSGELGYIGAGTAAAFVRDGSNISDVDYTRRVTLNVVQIASIDNTAGVLTLSAPLPAGDPTGMSVQTVLGFCDREGSRFFQEWSALFVFDGMQGDRLLLYYPRLQADTPIAESTSAADGMETVRTTGSWRALAVVDPLDGERAVCFRSFLPASLP